MHEKPNLLSLGRMRHVPLTVGRRKGRVPIASQEIFLRMPHNGAANAPKILGIFSCELNLSNGLETARRRYGIDSEKCTITVSRFLQFYNIFFCKRLLRIREVRQLPIILCELAELTHRGRHFAFFRISTPMRIHGSQPIGASSCNVLWE